MLKFGIIRGADDPLPCCQELSLIGFVSTWMHPILTPNVSIHAHTWGATCATHDCASKCSVSIHAPAWGATATNTRVHNAFEVSIHAPAWGATEALRAYADEVEFQSTRPRGARQLNVICNVGVLTVSIHAPAWGATICKGKAWEHLEVSIHAPAWGATASQKRLKIYWKCFNPRARVGRDHTTSNAGSNATRFQSTRPRGARPGPHPDALRPGRFNPRARVGRDICGCTAFAQRKEFQSTRPRGARPRA